MKTFIEIWMSFFVSATFWHNGPILLQIVTGWL